MRPPSNLQVALALALAASAGCQCAAFAPGARFLCDGQGQCPDEQVCDADGICVPVDGGAGGGAEDLTFAPTDDASVHEQDPTVNFGTQGTLEVDLGPVHKQLLLKFAVSGVGARIVTRARLVLHCVGSSDSGGGLAQTADASWSEATVTWDTAPAAGAPFASLGSVSSGSTYEVDCTGVVTGDGVYSFRMSPGSSDGADYDSKEGGTPPQLVLTVQ